MEYKNLNEHDKEVIKTFIDKLLIQLKAMTMEVSVGSFYGDDFLRLCDIEDEIEHLIK